MALQRSLAARVMEVFWPALARVPRLARGLAAEKVLVQEWLVQELMVPVWEET